MKKAIILYDSIYGNTKKVAMSLSRGLEAGGIFVDCHYIQEFDIKRIKNYEIIGIGAPSHFYGVSKLMKSFLNEIRLLKMENKQGFVFETNTDFKMAGSAAKRISRYLRITRLTIIHPVITGIVLGKEGPLQENTLDRMEKVGLNLSIKLINNINQTKKNNNNDKGIKRSKRKISIFYLNRLKWFLLGGGSLFFFIRALFLVSTGGDCFGTINLYFSWFLLLSETIISLITILIGFIGLIMWRRRIEQWFFLKKN